MRGLILVTIATSLPVFTAAAQTAVTSSDQALRIPPRRSFDHSARIVTDVDKASGRTKVWVLPGEDDMRLYSPNGGQTEMDFQVWYWLPVGPKDLPASVELLFETRGETTPGRPPHDLVLIADGRSLALQQAPQPMSRSGKLVFYATSAKMPLADFLTLVNASRVRGRWLGHEFALTAPQLEILRDLASRMRLINAN